MHLFRPDGNTVETSLQEQGMPIASPATIAPLRLRDSAPRPRHARRDHNAADGIKASDHAAFRAFVDANYHLFRDYVARRLNGPHAGAAEDALQEGLIKIWHEWDEWPTDEGERIRFARQALRIAALEAIRKRTGRDGSPRAGEVVVDFADLDGPAASAPAAEALARDLGRAIAEQSLVKDQLAFLEKASLVAAIATLTDLEQRVLFMTAQGDDCKEIATDLGVTHQQAREALMRGRRLCRMLIEHADGQKVSEQEAKLLWQYADGQLSGKRARELKRHIDHCTACQRLLGLEQSIGTNGALVVLPIPVLLLAAGKAATGSTAAATASTAGSGAGASVQASVGGTVLAPAAQAGWAGSVLAGLPAKAGLALAGLAVAGSIGGVWKLAHDRQQAREARTSAARLAPAPAPAPARPAPTPTPVRIKAASSTKPSATPAKAKTKRKARKASTRTRSATTTTARAATVVSSRPATSTTAAPAPSAARATTTRQPISRPASRPAKRTATTSKPKSTGGEFVLGSG